MPEHAALVHYHEIGLKGRNRSAFERRLGTNLHSVLAGLPAGPIARIASRLLVALPDDATREEALQRIARTPGVSNVCDTLVVERSMERIEAAALDALNDAGGWESFAIDARRSSTDFPVPSMEMNRRLGAYVQSRRTGRVDLGSPDVTCFVEVVQGEAYVYARRIAGPGGLPVGTSGRVVTLFSAGIDSPVAAWRMMKRGSVVVGVHFSGRPQTNDASERIAVELGSALERWGGMARLYVVPFGDLQRRIALSAPPDLRVLLYRRLMLRVAESIAKTEGAKALVTGESLGQVASQTLENIAAVDAAATMPVLRPLIGMDKLEIIGEARHVGTYELSIQKHADCCTLFMPRSPATHATVAEVEAGEADLDLPAMVREAVAAATWTDFRCDPYRPPKSRPRREAEA